ncbi:MAG: cytochrome C assembly protein [Candidatus Marinimicrobia bacterium]|nr:cytochrome C assembly protein [Candidatus Neomarinimicrobiota bacterium]|tara:strand:+ start:798 stop:1469 length:672 start_codon:yes stop_codon:yes gene_type:complete
MTNYFQKKNNQWSILVIIILSIINILNIVYNTPMVPDQHWAQKIFYVHVPSAWIGFLSYFIVMISGFMYLTSRDNKWDNIGLAASEIGTFFMALVLITGPIWATPIWGQPWVWEPRLVTTLILFLIYIGYFMIRAYGGYIERMKRNAAALGIVAFINVPIIFLSVQFWSPEIQSHPQVEMAEQPSEILSPFIFSLIVFTMLYTVMIRYRVYVIHLNNGMNEDV